MMEQVPMNRTDGCGLITYEKAEQWAGELGLDYVPSQFCIRQNFIKGMLCVFPILEFCQEINQGNYLVDTIYRDDRAGLSGQICGSAMSFSQNPSSSSGTALRAWKPTLATAGKQASPGAYP